MRPEDFATVLREIYAPEFRRQLADSPVWASADAVATHITEEAVRAAIRHVEEGRRSDRGAFVRAVEFEMRAAAAQLAREAGGHLDEDGLFWPDAQVVCGDDEPFPF